MKLDLEIHLSDFLEIKSVHLAENRPIKIEDFQLITNSKLDENQFKNKMVSKKGNIIAKKQ